jgi:hypothetical protein
MPTYTDEEIQNKLAEFDAALPILTDRVDAIQPRVFRTTDGADITDYGVVEDIAQNQAEAAEDRANAYTDIDRTTLLEDAQTAADLSAEAKANLAQTLAEAYADGIVDLAEQAAIDVAIVKADAAEAAAILHTNSVLEALDLQDGIDGNKWYSFNGTPPNGTGEVNDFALVDGRLIYKHDGAAWVYYSDLIGPAGISVTAQYTDDIDSDPIVWYNVFSAERIWMQQSVDNGVSWSAPIRIVGEAGQGGNYTDFMFVDKNGTDTPTTNPETYAGWQDGPPDVIAGHYVWMRSALKDTDDVIISVADTPGYPAGDSGWSTPTRITSYDGSGGAGWWKSIADAEADGREPVLYDTAVSGGSAVTYDGSDWVPAAAFITGPLIVDDSIIARHVEAGSITANEIDVTDLFSKNITASGSVTVGSLSGIHARLSATGSLFKAQGLDGTETITLFEVRANGTGVLNGLPLTDGTVLGKALSENAITFIKDQLGLVDSAETTGGLRSATFPADNGSDSLNALEHGTNNVAVSLNVEGSLSFSGNPDVPEITVTISNGIENIYGPTTKYGVVTTESSGGGGEPAEYSKTLNFDVNINDNPASGSRIYTVIFSGRANTSFMSPNASFSVNETVVGGSGGGSSYALPTASSGTKGGVKIGSGLEMTGEVLSATASTPYTHPDFLSSNQNGSLASVIDQITTNDQGHVTFLSSRTLTLSNLGYTGDTNANRITDNDQILNSAGYVTTDTNTQLSQAQVDTYATNAGFIKTDTNTLYSSGQGLVESGNTFSLGTPGTITGISGNTLYTSSHTHEIGTLNQNTTGNADTATYATDANDSLKLGGAQKSPLASAWTMAQRDNNADLLVRTIKPNLNNTAVISGAMAFRVNDGGDPFLRFCSSTSSIRTFLDTPTRTGGNASGDWGINITGSSGSCTGTSLYADRLNLYATSSSSSQYQLHFLDSIGRAYTTGKLSVQPSSGNLTSSGSIIASGFNGSLTGNVTGNVTGSSGSCTGNAVTASTADEIVVGTSFTGKYNVPVSIGDGRIFSNSGIQYKGDTNKLTVAGDVQGSDCISTSDIRSKINFEPILNALDKVCQLNGLTFDHLEKRGDRAVGHIAQEVEKVLPEAIYDVEDARLGIKKVLSTTAIPALHTEAIKELKAKNDVLEAKNNALEARIARLEELLTNGR